MYLVKVAKLYNRSVYQVKRILIKRGSCSNFIHTCPKNSWSLSTTWDFAHWPSQSPSFNFASACQRWKLSKVFSESTINNHITNGKSLADLYKIVTTSNSSLNVSKSTGWLRKIPNACGLVGAFWLVESSIRLQTNDQQFFPKYYEPAFFLTSVHSNDFSHQVFPSMQTLASHVHCYGNAGTSKSRMYIY